MRFGCQIWVSKDEVKYVNEICTLDLLEKSVKKTTLGKHVFWDFILETLSEGFVCFRGTFCRPVGPLSSAWERNCNVLEKPNCLPPGGHRTRGSVSLFENDLTEVLNGWTDFCMKSNKSFSLCDIEISREWYAIWEPYLGLQGSGKTCQ